MAGKFSGLYQGVEYRAYPNNVQGANDLTLALAVLTVGNYKDHILGAFYFPSVFISTTTNNIVDNVEARDDVISVSRVNYVGSQNFKPNNRKLLTYPYSYFTIDAGTASKAYKWEFFGQAIQFRLIGVLTATNPTVLCIPLNYEGMTENVTKQLMIQGFEHLTIASMGFPSIVGSQGIVSSLLGIYASAALSMADPRLGYAGLSSTATKSYGTNAIKNEYAGLTGENVREGKSSHFSESANRRSSQSVDELARPRAEEGILMNAGQQLINYVQGITDNSTIRAGSGNPNVGARTSDIRAVYYSISEQFARKIDKFFDCYGYAVNEIKIPNTHARPYWTYTKTKGCIVNGPFPSSDKTKIESIFDDGIRFWRVRNGVVNVGDYTQDNRVNH